MNVYQYANKFRERLARGDAHAASAMARVYSDAYKAMRVEIESITREINTARTVGEIVNLEWLKLKRSRLESMSQQIEREMYAVTRAGSQITKQMQAQGFSDGITDAAKLIEAAAQGRALSVTTRVGDQFNARATQFAVGFAQDGSPLDDLFRRLGPDAAKAMREALILGVARGRHTSEIAREMRDALGGNMARALTIARTEHHRAHREATREVYKENATAVAGYIWQCAQSNRTCAMCWAMQGSEHETSAAFGTHPNCRCIMLPKLRENPLQVKSGDSLFRDLDESEQAAILGPAKFAAWRAGSFQLSDLVAEYQSAQWGLVRFERSLRDLLGG